MAKATKQNVGLVLSLMELNCLAHVLFCMYCLDYIEKQPTWFYTVAAVGMAYYLISGITNALGAARLLDTEHDKKE